MEDFNDNNTVLSPQQKSKKIWLLVLIPLIILLIILVVFLYNQKTGPTCIENWSCEMWSSCSEQITQTRTCTDLNNCG
ncbi:MAG: hypothetical protein V1815_03240, partial [Candidatus Woesearchaeota archaeon]